MKVGDLVEFTPDLQKVTLKEFQLQGRGILKAQNLRNGNLVYQGEDYPLLVLEQSVVLVKRNDGFFMFNQQFVLPGESAKEFYPHAVEFGNKNQLPRSHSFDWHGMKLTVLDIGYLIYQHESGECHLTDGTKIRYLLAERDDGQVFYLEDCQTGADRYWLGKSLGTTLDQNIGNIGIS